jgi:hypothetical protein
VRRALAPAAGLAAVIAAALLVRPPRVVTPPPPAPAGLRGGPALVEPGAARLAHGARPLAGRATPAPARESPAVRFLSSHSASEVALLVRFERLTGRGAPAGLIEVMQRRRQGATSEELVALATRRFAGDPLGRAAVLEWLRESASP